MAEKAKFCKCLFAKFFFNYFCRFVKIVSCEKFNLSLVNTFCKLGVNGAGKTTAMKMLTTLIMPTSGEAELLGHSIKTDRAAVKQIIGISPQESAAAMNLTARENLELMAEVYGFSKKAAKAKASELIERFSMQEFENRKAKRLSGGEVRRLSIAMATKDFQYDLSSDDIVTHFSTSGRDSSFSHFATDCLDTSSLSARSSCEYPYFFRRYFKFIPIILFIPPELSIFHM
jgi:ABC-type taurine transport system ATPase subunit